MESIADLNDRRILRVAQANQGAAAARNHAASLCRGSWLAFLDADDLWYQDHLTELDRVSRAYPEAALIGTGWSLFAHAPVAAARPAGKLRPIDYFATVGKEGGIIRTSSIAMRRDAWEALGGFRPFRTGHDSELWVRAALRYPVAVSSRITLLYRTSTGGLSDRKRLTREVPRRLQDLSPALVTLLDHHPAAGADLFVLRHLRWRLDEAIRDGDLACVRALERLYPDAPPLADRLFLRSAHLPIPLARLSHRALRILFAIGRRIGRPQLQRLRGGG
jgi:glycosyltransferase involved in cell wall biosynthesis